MTDINEPWSDAVPVAETTVTDYQSRTTSITVYDNERVVRRRLDYLADAWGLDGRSATCDRAVRCYVAHRLDTEDVLDLRTEVDVTVLVPPSGWLADHGAELFVDCPDVEGEYVAEEFDRQFTPTIPPAVHRMVQTLVDHYDAAESLSGFVGDAVAFCCRCE